MHSLKVYVYNTMIFLQNKRIMVSIVMRRNTDIEFLYIKQKINFEIAV